MVARSCSGNNSKPRRQQWVDGGYKCSTKWTLSGAASEMLAGIRDSRRGCAWRFDYEERRWRAPREWELEGIGKEGMEPSVLEAK
jgi:hypothetical protein